MSDISYIYALVDPRTGARRYVGQTVNPKRRFRRHINDTRSGLDHHVNRWIRGLLRSGLSPTMEILEVCTVDAANRREVILIAESRKSGAVLTNLTDGGGGMQNPAAETRQKLQHAQKGRTFSAEHRRRLSEAGRGPRPDVRGRHLSDGTKRKISQSMCGHPVSADVREAVSRASSGPNSSKTKLTLEQVREMRTLWESGSWGQRALAERYGIAVNTVSCIVNRVRWKNHE